MPNTGEKAVFSGKCRMSKHRTDTSHLPKVLHPSTGFVGYARDFFLLLFCRNVRISYIRKRKFAVNQFDMERKSTGNRARGCVVGRICGMVADMLFVAGALCSCEIIEYHPYDARVEGETGLTEKNIRLIEDKMRGKREFRFAMISDTQRQYDETAEVVNILNSRDDIDFVLHGGDVADFGETKEFLWSRDFLNKLRVPYVCLLGNHDCLGTGFNVYLEVFGEDNFAFTAGNVRFVCLNTNALEFDYSRPVPDFDFMEDELRNMPVGIEKTVVAMHVPPGDDEFNNNVGRAFEHYVTSFPRVQFCLFGHIHRWAEEEFFGDGVVYYGCTTIGKRGYYVVTIKEEGYEVERCDF